MQQIFTETTHAIAAVITAEQSHRFIVEILTRFLTKLFKIILNNFDFEEELSEK